MNLKEIGWEGVEWVGGWRKVAICCEHGNEPSNSMKLREFLD
jgi:hypothetical protein